MNVLELDAANYSRHMLHAEDRVWVEKNCYVDIWIELVHAVGCEPLAMMGFVSAVDFEGDQWTFFKPSHDELRELYGIDVQELNVWRPLREHAAEHLAEGKLISTEADAFFLPDTAGTDYQRQHTKTTIVIQEFDLEGKRLGYFHNAGYYALEGEDFVNTFRVGFPADPTYMPLFAETVRIDRLKKREDLREAARPLLKKHLAHRPTENPVKRFAARFTNDLAFIQSQGLPFYHAWAFATIRQLGASMELLALHLKWLGEEAKAAPFDQISNLNKTFILKAARAVNAKRALDAAPMFDEMAAAWQTGMEGLDSL